MDRNNYSSSNYGFPNRPGTSSVYGQRTSASVPTPTGTPSIFGLISKVNQGIVNKPKGILKTSSPTVPNDESSFGLQTDSNTTDTQQKEAVFQSARSRIQQIQMGMWNPLAADGTSSTSVMEGNQVFKVPQGLPSNKNKRSVPEPYKPKLDQRIESSSSYDKYKLENPSKLISLVDYADDETDSSPTSPYSNDSSYSRRSSSSRMPTDSTSKSPSSLYQFNKDTRFDTDSPLSNIPFEGSSYQYTEEKALEELEMYMGRQGRPQRSLEEERSYSSDKETYFYDDGRRDESRSYRDYSPRSSMSNSEEKAVGDLADRYTRRQDIGSRDTTLGYSDSKSPGIYPGSDDTYTRYDDKHTGDRGYSYSGHPDRKDDDYTDRNVSDYPDRKVTDYSDRNVKDYTNRNVNDYSDRKDKQYTNRNVNDYSDRKDRQYTDRNVKDYTDRKVTDYSDRNFSDYTDRKVKDYTDRNVNDYSDRNVKDYTDRNVDEYSDRKDRQYTDRKVSDYTNRNVSDYPGRKANDYTNRKVSTFTDANVSDYADRRKRKSRFEDDAGYCSVVTDYGHVSRSTSSPAVIPGISDNRTGSSFDGLQEGDSSDLGYGYKSSTSKSTYKDTESHRYTSSDRYSGTDKMDRREKGYIQDYNSRGSTGGSVRGERGHYNQSRARGMRDSRSYENQYGDSTDHNVSSSSRSDCTVSSSSRGDYTGSSSSRSDYTGPSSSRGDYTLPSSSRDSNTVSSSSRGDYNVPSSSTGSYSNTPSTAGSFLYTDIQTNQGFSDDTCKSYGDREDYDRDFTKVGSENRSTLGFSAHTSRFSDTNKYYNSKPTLSSGYTGSQYDRDSKHRPDAVNTTEGSDGTHRPETVHTTEEFFRWDELEEDDYAKSKSGLEKNQSEYGKSTAQLSEYDNKKEEMYEDFLFGNIEEDDKMSSGFVRSGTDVKAEYKHETAGIDPSQISLPRVEFTCKDCEVSCTNKAAYDVHLQSDAHLLTLQRKAQELFQIPPRTRRRKSRFDTNDGGLPLVVGGIQPPGVAALSLSTPSTVIPPMPQGPLEGSNIRTTRLQLSWRRLTDVEEAMKDEYLVECRNARETHWVNLGNTKHHEYSVEGLQANTDYLFRVSSVNGAEKSDFLESVLITTKRAVSPYRHRSRSMSKERSSSRRSRSPNKRSPERSSKWDGKRHREERSTRDKTGGDEHKARNVELTDEEIEEISNNMRIWSEKEIQKENPGNFKIKTEEKLDCELFTLLKKYQDPPLLGLEHVYEIRSYNPVIPTYYNCKQCWTKGSGDIMMKHICGVPHRMASIKMYNPVLFDAINMLPTKKDRNTKAFHEAKLIEDKDGRGYINVLKMCNPADHNGKYFFNEPVLVRAPPTTRPTVEEEERKMVKDKKLQEDMVEESEFSKLYTAAVEAEALPDKAIVGLSHVKEIIHPDNKELPKYVCNLCKCCLSHGTILFHLIGKKHRMTFLKTYNKDLHDQLSTSRTFKKELPIVAAEIHEQNGLGEVKVVKAKKDRLWKFRDNTDASGVSQDNEDGTGEDGARAVKFGIKKSDDQTLPITQTNVFDDATKHSSKEILDWTKENEALQAKLQNQSIIKSSRLSKFICMYGRQYMRLPVLGLQWVTEFQRPDPTAEPWFMCFMCQQKLQWKNILDHVTSTSHRFNYLKTNYKDLSKSLFERLGNSKVGMRHLIEEYSMKVVKIEGHPKPVEVMIELNINTEALKSVMKVKDSSKIGVGGTSVGNTATLGPDSGGNISISAQPNARLLATSYVNQSGSVLPAVSMNQSTIPSLLQINPVVVTQSLQTAHTLVPPSGVGRAPQLPLSNVNPALNTSSIDSVIQKHAEQVLTQQILATGQFASQGLGNVDMYGTANYTEGDFMEGTADQDEGHYFDGNRKRSPSPGDRHERGNKKMKGDNNEVVTEERSANIFDIITQRLYDLEQEDSQSPSSNRSERRRKGRGKDSGEQSREKSADRQRQTSRDRDKRDRDRQSSEKDRKHATGGQQRKDGEKIDGKEREGKYSEREGRFRDREGRSIDREGRSSDRESRFSDREGRYSNRKGRYGDEERSRSPKLKRDDRSHSSSKDEKSQKNSDRTSSKTQDNLGTGDAVNIKNAAKDDAVGLLLVDTKSDKSGTSVSVSDINKTGLGSHIDSTLTNQPGFGNTRGRGQRPTRGWGHRGGGLGLLGAKPGDMSLTSSNLNMSVGNVGATRGIGNVGATMGIGNVGAAMSMSSVGATMGIGNVGATMGIGNVGATMGIGNVGATMGIGNVGATMGIGNVGATMGIGNVGATMGIGNVGATMGIGNMGATMGIGNMGATMGTSHFGTGLQQGSFQQGRPPQFGQGGMGNIVQDPDDLIPDPSREEIENLLRKAPDPTRDEIDHLMQKAPDPTRDEIDHLMQKAQNLMTIIETMNDEEDQMTNQFRDNSNMMMPGGPVLAARGQIRGGPRGGGFRGMRGIPRGNRGVGMGFSRGGIQMRGGPSRGRGIMPTRIFQGRGNFRGN